MELILYFDNLPPMPTNRAKALVVVKKRPMYIKTPLAREFEKDVLNRLKEFKDEIDSFTKEFDSLSHFIIADYSFFTPVDILFTQKGSISNKSSDLDSHKLFQDTLFSFMGLDDKLIRDVRYRSLVSKDDKHKVKINFKLEKLECLKNTAFAIQNTTEHQSQDLTSFALL